MTVIIAAIVGFLAGRMLWLALRKSFQRQTFLRQNFQGITLPTAVGVVLPLTLVLVEALRSTVGGFGLGDEPIITAPRAAALSVITGFALLGLLDDLAGTTKVRGIGGHLRSLAQGQLTTGGIKLVGGVALSLIGAAFLVPDQGGVAIVLTAGVIAMTANLINLFDLRPGRATKVSLLAFIVLAAVTLLDAALVPVAIVVGAAAALVLDDIKERLMLGDTGANALGAALGIGIATQLGDNGRLIAFAVLLLLNLASEFMSFSKVIDSVGPLRAADMMGRKSQSTVDVREDAGPNDQPRPTESSTRVSVGGAHEASYAREQAPTLRSDSPPARQERPFSSLSDSSPSETQVTDEPATTDKSEDRWK